MVCLNINKDNNYTFSINFSKFLGKDAAGIALEAINHAKDMGIDVVMIDTAGRMQDNEPLMRALAKVVQS